MAERLLSSNDPLIRATVGSDGCSRRALMQRLRRAERAGLLPKRRYLSSQRFVYGEAEFLAAIERLPRSYAAIPA